MLRALAIENFRSCRSLLLPLGSLTLVTGPNGSGKSNLYRALRLLHDVAEGRAIASLAAEGGLHSVLWAGPEVITSRMRRGEVEVQGGRRKEPVALRVGMRTDEFGYAIDFGLLNAGATAFTRDPEIKRESIWHGEAWSRASAMVDRDRCSAQVRGTSGGWERLTNDANARESVLTFADPRSAPEAYVVRRMIQSWRFYDHFRTDREAPARAAQVGTWTGALAHDGHDLAAALQTIMEVGAEEELEEAVADAFPGARVEVTQPEDGRFGLAFQQRGLLRPLDGRELSDGTLRYLLWLAALLTPRPPTLLVLNEPETSLHPDLLEPLGRRIQAAAKVTQVWVVSHAPPLVDLLRRTPGCVHLELERELGETRVNGELAEDAGAWRWPTR